jgi:protein-tyrosine-phosphatase
MTPVRASTFRRSVASALIAALTFAGMAASAHATVIGTEAATQSTALAASGHARLNAALAHADVVEILKSRGVDPDAARARAAALSDAEAADLAARIDESPAGGINALAAVALVFVVLVITDILGFTKIFSFTSAIK